METKENKIALTKSVSFNRDNLNAILKYMEDNNCNFNKAVNNMLSFYKDIDMYKYLKSINSCVQSIHKHIIENQEQLPHSKSN